MSEGSQRRLLRLHFESSKSVNSETQASDDHEDMEHGDSEDSKPIDEPKTKSRDAIAMEMKLEKDSVMTSLEVVRAFKVKRPQLPTPISPEARAW